MTEDPSAASKIIHSSLPADNGFALIASDAPTAWSSMRVAAFHRAKRRRRRPAARLLGQAARRRQMALPLERAPWGDVFGMLIDRFGTSWMIKIEGSEPGLLRYGWDDVGENEGH